MIRVKQPIVVEGKYDKITLENIIDGLIITTDGFGIFKNKEKRAMLRTLAQKNGIIIMTDSDSAGSVIRSHLKQVLGDCKIINVYVPCVEGKEKRKTVKSREGLLGVEGMTAEIILDALERSGVSSQEVPLKEKGKISKTDLFTIGLNGRENSAKLRENFLKFLGLPQKLSSNSMLDILNTLFTYDEFKKVIAKWQEGQTKS